MKTSSFFSLPIFSDKPIYLSQMYRSALHFARQTRLESLFNDSKNNLFCGRVHCYLCDAVAFIQLLQAVVLDHILQNPVLRPLQYFVMRKYRHQRVTYGQQGLHQNSCWCFQRIQHHRWNFRSICESIEQHVSAMEQLSSFLCRIRFLADWPALPLCHCSLFQNLGYAKQGKAP